MTARKEPPMPDKVKVGPLTYDIKNDSLAHMLAEYEQKAGLYGRCDNPKQALILSPDLAPGQLRATLVHEILHAVINVSGVSLGNDDAEERAVAAIEMPLLGVIRDNPALIAYLTGGTA